MRMFLKIRHYKYCLKMLYYDRICDYWFFNEGFKSQHYACNVCHDLAIRCK